MRRLLKLPVVKERCALGTTSVYEGVKKKTFPPPIKLARSSAWVESEIEAVIAARIAGKSDAEVRALVAALVALRQQDAA